MTRRKRLNSVRKSLVSSSTNHGRVRAAVELADRACEAASREHRQDVWRLLCGQCNGPDRITMRPPDTNSGLSDTPGSSRSQTEERRAARDGAAGVSVNPKRHFPANQNPWRKFGRDRAGG